MKKRLLFLEILRKLLVGDASFPQEADTPEYTPQKSTTTGQIEPENPETTPVELAFQSDAQADLDNLPQVGEEVRDLLRSTDWEEVNQGLELLAASHHERELKTLHTLLDVERLKIRDSSVWAKTLGIPEVNEINAVAKLASLTGALQEVTRIELNGAYFADPDLFIDLSLLSEATLLEELIVNGVSIHNPGKLSELSQLRHLVLGSNCIEWDHDEDTECFQVLEQLQMLTVGTWPWDDLIPLKECGNLTSLRIRGGELENLEGIRSLTSLHHVELHDCCSLNQVDGIESLEKLETLILSNVSIGEIMTLSGLHNLRSIMLESSERVDLSGLGRLGSLEKAEIECREAGGLGELAYCKKLKHLKFGSFPDYICGESRLRLGQRELENLMACWKDPNTKRSKVSWSYGQGIQSVIMVLGINIFECLSGQITVETFRERITSLSQKHAEELRMRCYWPWIEAEEHGYSPTHPVGQFIAKARLAGSISEQHCMEFSLALSRLLPQAPQR